MSTYTNQYGEWNTRFYITVGSVVLGIMLFFALLPFTVVSVGERTIILRNGAINRVLAEGFHFVTPLIESTKTLDVTTRLDTVEAQAASKDLQTVTAMIAVNYQLDESKITEIYTQYRGEVESRVIAPAVQEAVKAATAKYTAEELITKRELVRADIVTNLKEKVTAAHIFVANVSITDLDFSPQFNAAIEAKVQAEQDALTQKNLLEKVKYEAEQQVAKAQAEATSIRLQGDAANSQNYIRLKELEVALARANKWNGVLPVNVYGSAPIPFLDVK